MFSHRWRSGTLRRTPFVLLVSRQTVVSTVRHTHGLPGFVADETDRFQSTARVDLSSRRKKTLRKHDVRQRRDGLDGFGSVQIIVIRRWFDDTMELVNTEVEFDADSLSELKRNNFNLVADIEANLKLFLTTRWHNAKKHTLPPIFNLDEANEVDARLPHHYRSSFSTPFLELPDNADQSDSRQMELLVRTKSHTSFSVSKPNWAISNVRFSSPDRNTF